MYLSTTWFKLSWKKRRVYAPRQPVFLAELSINYMTFIPLEMLLHNAKNIFTFNFLEYYFLSDMLKILFMREKKNLIFCKIFCFIFYWNIFPLITSHKFRWFLHFPTLCHRLSHTSNTLHPCCNVTFFTHTKRVVYYFLK